MKQFILILSFSLLAVSCKTAKKESAESSSETLESGGKITTVNAPIADIAIAHYNLFNDFNTLRINADVDYKDQNMQQSPNAEIRIEKGKQILIFVKAFGITGAKVYLTPERASFYEILGGTYYDGDYDFISNFLGTEITYENVENLLLGKAFYNLNEYDYTKEDSNLLELKLNQFLVKLLLGSQNEITSTEVKQDQSTDKLVVNYLAYQTAENLFLPKEINIHAMQKKDVHIKIDYRRVSVNQPLDFRYRIPKNSKEIRI